MIIDKYHITSEDIRVAVEIRRVKDEFVPIYHLKLPKLKEATLAFLEEVKERLITELKVSPRELLQPKVIEVMKERFRDHAGRLIREGIPGITPPEERLLTSLLIHEMLGLGNIELLLADGELEEIVINGSKEPLWVYHKRHGWLKTNILIPSETEIEDYAAAIGRRVGRQITTLDPLMDAHLVPTGDRVNATLFPISTVGNTLTIRKFRRKPWTITDFIENRTVSTEVVAFLWLLIQYEMSMIISGGTATGKTSFLNTLMPFIPPNHRIISIEDTREINLPEFLHWVPLTTREPNPEGKGGVTMLDLLVNSLRMRPDRIVVGEIRRAAEAEVLFEAMHTGHSVYATLHADTAEQTYRRLTGPPISVPEPLLEALDVTVVMFRDRRKGIRRVFEIAELIPAIRLRILYRWNPTTDAMEKHEESYRLHEKLRLFSGLTDEDIEKDLKDKQAILTWMVKNQIKTVNGVGKLVADYYQDPARVVRAVRKGVSATQLIPKRYLKG